MADYNTLSPSVISLIFVLTLWTLPWRGVALWKAAKNNDKKWFIVIFLLNTMAVLDIFYIFYFSKKNKPAVN